MTRPLLLSFFFIIGCTSAFAQSPATVTVTTNTLSGTTNGDVCPGNALLPVGTVFTQTNDAAFGLPGYEATVAGIRYPLAYASSRNQYYLLTSGGNNAAVKLATDINDAQGTYTAVSGCPGSFGIDEVLLPVTLTSFTGEYKSKSISLKWNTAQEEGNEGFEVQRSTEGQNWAMLDFVASINGGNTAGTYSLVDSDPLPGVNYYRLKQMNYDGSFAYSEIISTVAGGSEDLLVFPNPAQEVLNVRFVTDEATPYRVVNAKGVEVLRGMLSSGGDVSVGELPAGIYHLSIDGEAGVVTQRFLKQ